MKYRTKLLYTFLSLSLISSFLAILIIYGRSIILLKHEVRSKILAITVSSWELIKKIDVSYYILEGHKDHSSSHVLEEYLREIRDRNRRQDAYVEYVYLVHWNPETKRYEYIAGSAENPEDKIFFGEPYVSRGRLPNHSIQEPFVTQNIHRGARGVWLTGYAPIDDGSGKEIAILAVDVRIQDIFSDMEQLFFYGLIALGISLIVAVLFAFFLSNFVTRSLHSICKNLRQIGEGNLKVRSHLNTQDEFEEVSNAINKMTQGLQERERLKMGLAKYVSQYALDELLKREEPVKLEGERKRVSVLFGDIRNFTSLSEQLAPEEVVNLLNEFLAAMIDVVFQYKGTLDKFIGDGLMVEFGAPIEDEQEERHAIYAGIAMQRKLQELNQKWESEGKPTFQMGIGIHAGYAIVGNIGSEKRMEYTAIGDTVNVASRLEEMCKQMNRNIIISDSIYEKVKEHVPCENLDFVEIAGRKGNIQVYSVDPYDQKITLD